MQKYDCFRYQFVTTLVSESLMSIRKYNPKYSKELERIIEKSICPNQENRFACCDELIKALKKEQSKMEKKRIVKKIRIKKVKNLSLYGE